MFLVREARPADVHDVLRLASMLDTINLPADEAALAVLAERSRTSFAQKIEDVDDGYYLFALEDLAEGRVIGLSMIIAAHGMPDDPHHSFMVDVDERYSRTLDKLCRHQTLTFRQSFTPHTEIGALILDPAYRGHAAKLGRFVSFSRFLYIAMFRERFKDRVQAELLPPFEPDGSSLLWSWLGKTFTGLTYQEADRLSRQQNEFMKSLFPSTPIYTALMPEEVRALIGAVGPSTLGVAKMLESVGFHFNNHIDPFDGGPHFEARVKDVKIVAEHRTGPVLAERPPGISQFGLVGARDPEAGFRVVQGVFSVNGDEIWVAPEALELIQLAIGDRVSVAPYP